MTDPTDLDVPVLDLDPSDDATLADPAPFHERLRDAGPLVWLSRYDVYASGRYDQVQAALKNPDDLVSSAGAGMLDLRTAENFRPPSLLIEADPPAHTPRRALMDHRRGP